MAHGYLTIPEVYAYLISIRDNFKEYKKYFPQGIIKDTAVPFADQSQIQQDGQAVPNRPKSGDFYIVDRSKCRKYLMDNHSYKKKRDKHGNYTKSTMVSYKRLKINGELVIICRYYYGSGASFTPLSFKRRTYKLLKHNGYLFIHYFDYTAYKKNVCDLKISRSESVNTLPLLLHKLPDSNVTGSVGARASQCSNQ